MNAFKQSGKKREKRSLSEIRETATSETSDQTSRCKKSDHENASHRPNRQCVHPNELGAENIFKDLKSRRGSIMRPNKSISSLQDYSSAAGVLMTCQNTREDEEVFDLPVSRINSQGASHRLVVGTTDLTPVCETGGQPTFLRSYSFGNDAKIIRNLQEGSLKALRHELERNHQALPEEDLTDTPAKESNTSIPNTRPSDLLVGEAADQAKSMTMPESFRRFSASAFQSERSSSVDGWFASRSRNKVKPQQSLDAMSPIKDIVNNGLSFFSSENAMASIKSGLKYAAKLTDSPAKRATAKDGQEEPSLACDSEESVKGGRADGAGLHRSRTVPSEDSRTLQLLEDGDASNLSRTPSESSSASPWSKSLSGKRVDYWNSTLKSAATSMASRFSEIKNNLSTNSPAKLTGTISQWATLVAEKIPSNFVGDEEENSSEQSLDMRRTGSAVSEDDVSELSREGSFAKVRGMSLLNMAAFEVMERHYNKPLDQPTGRVVLEIQISSCCRCYVCSALVFDEEVMEGWSADDSNLNTQCVHCSNRFVPLLTVTLIDKKETASEDKSFTVPYLSPLVLRKEVENVLEHEGDMCLLQQSFVDAHPIIYWNLVWYFERTNLPTFLPRLALSHDLVSFLVQTALSPI